MCFDADALPPVAGVSGSTVDSSSMVLTSADGTPFRAVFARPSASGGVGVVVLPDVRGLFRFYEELAVRLAEAGHAAVAIDYFGRTAGVEPRDDDFPFMDHVAQTTREGVQADVDAAVAYLRGSCSSVVTLGFCFGGRRALVAGAAPGGGGLAGAIGFYGRPGDGPDGPGPATLAPSIAVPVLALYGGDDPGIPPSDVDALEKALTAAGVEHEVVTYQGAPHSFFDRKQEEYAAESADAWGRVLGFLGKRGGHR